MGNENGIAMASLQINADMVKNMVKQAVAVSVADALGGNKGIIQGIVSAMLDRTVNDHGKPATGYGTVPFADFMVKEQLCLVAKEVLSEFLNEKKDQIRDQLRKELAKPQRVKSLIGKFIEQAEAGLSSNWNFGCEITFKSDKS
ncbi:MAG: hypothetical protein WC449_06295 [Candidatus Paceibacterota bacterium]